MADPSTKSVCSCIDIKHDHEPGKCGRYSHAFRGSVCLECFNWITDYNRYNRPVK